MRFVTRYATVLVMLAWVFLLVPCGPVSAASVISSAGWGWQNPYPQGNSLFGVWGSSSSDVFAVGANGTILHYDGNVWNAMESGTPVDLQAIWGSSSSDVFAVGDKGVILHYDGNAWSPVSIDIAGGFSDVWGSSATDVYAVGPGASAHYNGASWTASYDGRNAMRYPQYGVWGSSASDILVVSRNNMVGSATIMRDSGSGWIPESIPPTAQSLLAISGSSPSDVFAVGGGGTILHYDGASWSAMVSPTTVGLLRVWCGSSTDAFAVGGSGIVAHYGGTGWSSMISGTTSDLFSVWGSSSSDVFAVGDGGTILHYDGSGWTVRGGAAGGVRSNLYGICGNSSSDIFAVGEAGTILHYDGTSWSPMNSGTTKDLRSVWSSAPSDVFAVGQDGTIVHYDGSVWSSMDSGWDKELYGIWGSYANDIYAVGGTSWFDPITSTYHQYGVVLHYDGNTWSTVVPDADCVLYSIWGSSWSDIFVTGDGSLIGHYNGNTGKTWSFTHYFNGDDRLGDIGGRSADDVFAVGTYHILHYDGRHVWSIANTSTDGGLFYGVWADPASSASDAFFMVQSHGGILRYDGKAWQPMTSGTVNDLNDIWGISSSDVFAVGDSGTILHYHDYFPPVVSSISPDYGSQGETLNVVITGANLAEATNLDFGAGITVNSFSVDSATQVSAKITLGRGATIGTRDIALTTPGGNGALIEGFEIEKSRIAPLPAWAWAGVGLGVVLLVALNYLVLRPRPANL